MSRITTIALCELLRLDPKVDYIIDQILPVGSVAVLGGDSGIGKSWMTLSLALDVAAGTPWLGRFPVKQGVVLVVDEENAIPLLVTRLKKLVQGGSRPLDGLPIIFTVGQGVNLSNAAHVERLMTLVVEYAPSLMIIDSLVRVHRANENSATEMAAVFAELKRIQSVHPTLTILFTHHSSKSLMSTGGAGGGSNLRGSSDIRAFVDTQLAVKKAEQGLQVTQEKARWTEAVTPFGVSITDTTDGGVLVAAREAVAGHSFHRVDNFILAMLDTGQKTRKELVMAASQDGVAERTLDDRLKTLCQKNSIRKLKRRSDGATPYERVDQSAELQIL